MTGARVFAEFFAALTWLAVYLAGLLLTAFWLFTVGVWLSATQHARFVAPGAGPRPTLPEGRSAMGRRLIPIAIGLAGIGIAWWVVQLGRFKHLMICSEASFVCQTRLYSPVPFFAGAVLTVFLTVVFLRMKPWRTPRRGSSSRPRHGGP